MTSDIHSCGPYCDRPGCIKAQRDELRDKLTELRTAMELIATPRRPDGSWNRDREACRQLAMEALEGKA